MDSDFLDSYAPIDAEVVTDEAWPMPEAKPLEGKFDQPAPQGRWGELFRPLAERLRDWL
jgi:hypothetical protein